MGRVTIFALQDCPHCTRTKAALTEHNIPFTEISLSSHPDKRDDMQSLADQLTVPQVFFNEKHIGGADDTIALLNQWGDTAEERFKTEVESQPEPTDPRLAVPVTPAIVEMPAPPRDQEKSIRLPDGTMVTVLEITNNLKKIIPEKNLKYNLTVYKNAFKGTDAVKALMEEYGLPTSEAVSFGKYLQESNILHHVAKEQVFCNKNKFFRLQCYQQPDILNSFRIWTERVDDKPMNLLNRLKKLLGQIESAVTNKEGLVDYKSACKNELYPIFEEAVCELQGVNMGKMDNKTRLAFGINLYNLMIKYAFMKVGIGSTTLARGAFFSGVKFNIGGDILSFNDLENGVLRGNAAPFYGLFVPFTKTDPRRRLALDKVDCRIHFALNCGAKSCPQIKNFTASAIDEELQIVAQAFFEQEDNMRLVPETNELYLSKILSWYGIDFAPSKHLLPGKIVTFLRGEQKEALQAMINSGTKVFVNFNEYDWNTNASDFVPFDSSVLKPDTTTLTGAISNFVRA